MSKLGIYQAGTDRGPALASDDPHWIMAHGALDHVPWFDPGYVYDFFMWVLFAAISPGIIAFTLYTMVQKSLGASITGFTLYIFTVYSAIYGVLFFNEQLEYYHYLGTALVFGGVYLVKKKSQYEKKT